MSGLELPEGRTSGTGAAGVWAEVCAHQLASAFSWLGIGALTASPHGLIFFCK
jgi:hypothetical protein